MESLRRALRPLLLVLVPSVAWAEPTAADKETARRLMAEGRAHRDAHELDAALRSFKAADALMQVPTTGLQVARTEVMLGQLTLAREKALAVTRLPETAEDPKVFAEAREQARALADELEHRIPSLSIRLPPGAPSSLVVTVDGAAVPTASLVAPRAVDPGHHVVAVVTAGGARREASTDVAEGGAAELTLDVPVDPGAPPSTTPTSAPTSTPAVRYVTYGAFGVGAAALGTGIVTGVLAMSDFSAAKKAGCVGNQCGPQAYPELDKANTMALVSTIGFVTAGVGVGVGVVSLFFWRGARPAAAPSDTHGGLGAFSVSPWIGAGTGGLVGTF